MVSGLAWHLGPSHAHARHSARVGWCLPEDLPRCVQVRGLGQRATGLGLASPSPALRGKYAKRNAAGKAARPRHTVPQVPFMPRSRSRRQGPFQGRAHGLSENSGLSIYTQGVQRGAESRPGSPGHSPDQRQASWLRPDRGRPPSPKQASSAAERQRGFLCPTGYILFSVPKCHGCSCQGPRGITTPSSSVRAGVWLDVFPWHLARGLPRLGAHDSSAAAAGEEALTPGGP